MPDDRDLISDVLAGDTERFRLLVARYEGPVFAVARALTADQGQAEDVAQDTFLAAFQKLRQYDPARGVFRAWLLTIARNRCRDRARRRRPTVPVEDGMLPPAREPHRGEGTAALDACLTALPPQQRLAFLLVDVYDLPLAEVAALEQVPVGTIKSRASRARDALRALLRSPGGVR